MRQALGRTLKQPVPTGVPIGVVHEFKFVQVDEKNSELLFMASGMLNHAKDVLGEERPCRQAGQAVVECLLYQSLIPLRAADGGSHAMSSHVEDREPWVQS